MSLCPSDLYQLWQGPQNGSGTQEQYLYCHSSHPHQLSNLSQVSSSPTCSSKGTIDYTGSYDAWGNTTSQQRGSTTKSTAYDAQDHLLHWSSTTNTQQEWYLYDASGERVLRRSFDGTNTTLTVYAFGLEEHQYAYSGSGSTATNTGNTYYYDLGGQLLGTWDGSSPTTTFLLTDSLGSVVSSFNNPSSGAVMQGNQLYGPYGNQRLKQGSVSTNKGFTGQYNDGLTGLDYYNARYYDPTIGLFLSADPLGGLDAYSYVGGNPETETDPSGLYRIAATGPWGSPSANAYPKVIPTVVSLFPPQPYHWQPASSFPSRPRPVAPSFQPDTCIKIGCVFKALGEVGTVHAVQSKLQITGTAVTCSGICFVMPYSTGVSTTTYYRSSTAVPLVICTAGFDCYDRGGGGGGGEGNGGSEVMNSGDGGLPPSPEDGVGTEATGTSGGDSAPPGLNPDKPVTVIGETMTRVRRVFESLKTLGFDVNIYEPRGGVTIEANRSWFSYWVKEKGTQIVDIGPDPDRGSNPSKLYQMEVRSALRWNATVFPFKPGF